MHAIPNLISGFALQEEQGSWTSCTRQGPQPQGQYDYVRVRDQFNNKSNFLYYALRRYAAQDDVEQRRLPPSVRSGSTRASVYGFDIGHR